MVITRPPQKKTAQDKDLVDDAQIEVEFIRVRGRKSGAGLVALVCWSVASMTVSTENRKCYNPKIYQIQKLKFLGTNSN